MDPKIIWSHIGVLAQMNCSHTLGASYYQMYWYKQNPPEGIQLIVFTTAGGNPEFGDFNKDRYVADKAAAERGSLNGEEAGGRRQRHIFLCSQ
uniref:Immunoglobulin V-set domain-containing protein n=1 Tax=Anguilla anguilla TaxID=7936 RepID=A0A0E9S5R6_ANGAN